MNENRERCRSYSSLYIDGIRHVYLISWMNKQCERCGKFLKKKQKKYCSNCKIIMDKKRYVRYNKKRNINVF